MQDAFLVCWRQDADCARPEKFKEAQGQQRAADIKTTPTNLPISDVLLLHMFQNPLQCAR